MTSPPCTNHRREIVTCLLTALTALSCVGLASAAALAPAPRPALVFIIPVSVVVPMLTTWQSSSALAVLGRRLFGSRLDQRALGELRRELDRLPETGHPLGL